MSRLLRLDTHAAAHARDNDLRIRRGGRRGGLLQALERMDGAFPLSSQIAEAKAAGAALWHRDGGDRAAIQNERGAFFEAVTRLTAMRHWGSD